MYVLLAHGGIAKPKFAHPAEVRRCGINAASREPEHGMDVKGAMIYAFQQPFWSCWAIGLHGTSIARSTALLNLDRQRFTRQIVQM